jgi:tryptophanyl-tRNA synthetase
MARKRILSGMRPTGELHLGHLVGALENWARLQDEYECFYMVADWHALMSEYKSPQSMRGAILSNVADWIACGVDPARATIFIQSHIPEHAELALALSCVTPIAWLERCPTFKEQVEALAAKEVNTHAFLGYPVLQAADILLYRAELVPVGEDQLPHLELTREIVRRFNALFGLDFPEPQAKLTQVPRLLGLDRRKMSKSYDNYIALAEEPETVVRKAGTMITDPARLRRTDPGHPEVCNVHAYYRVFVPPLEATVAAECRGALRGCTDCKRQLAEELNRRLAPIRERREALLADGGREIRDILAAGEDRARAIAKETMREVKAALFGR